MIRVFENKKSVRDMVLEAIQEDKLTIDYLKTYNMEREFEIAISTPGNDFLHQAIKENKPKIVKFLLDLYSADTTENVEIFINTKKVCLNAFDLANELGHSQCMQWIKKHRKKLVEQQQQQSRNLYGKIFPRN